MTQKMNYIVAFAKDQNGDIGRTVVGLMADTRAPMTLERIKEIFEQAQAMDGRKLYKIEIIDCAYEDGDPECGEGKRIYKNEYIYDARENEMAIYRNSELVWRNENGEVTYKR